MNRLDLKRDFETRFSSEVTAFLTEAARLADENGQGIAIVGGVVRDLLLGEPTWDADLLVEPPVAPLVERLADTFHAGVTSHPRFLTFVVRLPSGKKIDIVTAREETYAEPAALPDVKPSTINNDLRRRDFTINAIACSLNAGGHGVLLDPFDGRADIAARLVRILHPASFTDDPTRIFRAARFAGRFAFDLEKETRRLLNAAVSARLPERLSAARRRHEFELILKEREPLPALKSLQEWGAVPFLHAEWTVLPEHETALSISNEAPADDLLENRLVRWLRPWGKTRAERMMTELSFEKAVKKKVLSRL